MRDGTNEGAVRRSHGCWQQVLANHTPHGVGGSLIRGSPYNQSIHLVNDILAELTFHKVSNNQICFHTNVNVNSGKFKIGTRKVNCCAFSSV